MKLTAGSLKKKKKMNKIKKPLARLNKEKKDQ